ncbi:hypothetical protein BGZ73_001165, partial [Actinomortierella ambigua]
SFSKAYSAAIAITFILCLTAISLWTVLTKTDCQSYTSSAYKPDICQPYNLFDGSEVRQSHDGIIPFKYKETVQDLGKDYKYRNNTYACNTMNSFRIVLSNDRSTQINYNASCVFDDGVGFTLIASTVSNDVGFGWDADVDPVCPNGTPNHQLQGFVFADNDNRDDGIVVGFGLNEDLCTLKVWLDDKGNIVESVALKANISGSKPWTLREYSRYKRIKAAEFALNKGMRFIVGYTCQTCSIKTGMDLVLTLLTALGSVGGITYTVLIFVAQTIFERPLSESSEYEKMELGKLNQDNDQSANTREE